MFLLILCMITIVIWTVFFLRTLVFFFFNDTATTEIYTLSLHDALPIYLQGDPEGPDQRRLQQDHLADRSEEHTSELQSRRDLVCRLLLEKKNVAETPTKLDPGASLLSRSASRNCRACPASASAPPFFFPSIRRPPTSTLFPYTTLFR